MNYEGTALEAPKFGLSFFCFDYADSKIKVFEITQKTLIKELDKLSQDEDYADIHAWDLKVNRTGLKMNTEYSILPSPRKKGSDEEIKAAWSAAEEAGYDLSNSSWVAIPLDLEDQLDLVDQVMLDRTITSRPGPRRQRLRELGLPQDANIGTLMTLWRYRRTNQVYVKGQPKFG